jgi:anti-sigma B factor antagonist
MSFDVAAEELADGAHAVSVRGELDLYTAPELEAMLLGALAAGAKAVVVDLGRTTFIDSVALGVLVSAAKQLRGAGGRLLVVCGPDIAHFFELAGLDRFLDLEATREAALARLHDAAG